MTGDQYNQLIQWIQQKQPVKIKMRHGEATFLPVKLYQDAQKLFVYNREMRLMNIAFDDIISIKPTRIYGSFDRRKLIHMYML
ncbi:hypothetical protein GFC29_727 [Anoxybacillus sp. B7M1]|nr:MULTISPECIES: hypothetical protein [Anoxybacillus]ANB56464.1 hypothetical protein GFC28_899 [Anoxybacillus sp. B2M1]ANB64579.1 hypothetical protein GFC29_727 [Anoxybacillus sp. B7M1]KXG09206.1 hypothetical protein AT864_02436 [Anoxybacillus sp. P3H1B]MBB3905828.1 hypothetical protein [Anoxybacillus rupiensis]MBS2772414.1 hypothetical protein [Anoxybacillus rupiensis]